jgi:hypothetical protein
MGIGVAFLLIVAMVHGSFGGCGTTNGVEGS